MLFFRFASTPLCLHTSTGPSLFDALTSCCFASALARRLAIGTTVSSRPVCALKWRTRKRWSEKRSSPRELRLPGALVSMKAGVFCSCLSAFPLYLCDLGNASRVLTWCHSKTCFFSVALLCLFAGLPLHLHFAVTLVCHLASFSLYRCTTLPLYRFATIRFKPLFLKECSGDTKKNTHGSFLTVLTRHVLAERPDSKLKF